MPIITRQCPNGHTYDLLERKGELISLGDGADDDISCPGCGAEDFTSVLTLGVGVRLGDVAGAGKFYPRFDRALHRTVNSEAHRNQIMKEMGLVPLDGGSEFGNDDPFEKGKAAERKFDKQLKDHAEYRERLRTHPGFRDLRRDMDRRGISLDDLM